MAKQRAIILNHHCHLPGCVGGPGDRIEVPEASANLLIERRGATLAPTSAAKPKAAAKPKTKPATKEADE